MDKKLLIFLLPIFILACKKPDPIVVPAPKLLASTRSINTNGHSILVDYSYNNKGILYQEITKDEMTGKVLYQEYGHVNGVLHHLNISNDVRKLSSINYEYVTEKLTKMRYYDYDQYLRAELLFDRIFEYQNGQLYKIATSANTGQPGEYTLFTFNGGNVTETKTYAGNGTLLNKAQYMYDDKINPYFAQYSQLYNALAYSKSNVIKATYTDHLANTVTTTLYNYTYNTAGQPMASYSAGKLLITFAY